MPITLRYNKIKDNAMQKIKTWTCYEIDFFGIDGININDRILNEDYSISIVIGKNKRGIKTKLLKYKKEDICLLNEKLFITIDALKRLRKMLNLKNKENLISYINDILRSV